MLAGLVGIHVEYLQVGDVVGDGATLEATPLPGAAPHLVVEPLVGAGQLEWFCASSVLVHGREVAVAFDPEGTRCGGEGAAGLALWLDGQLVRHAPALARLSVPL